MNSISKSSFYIFIQKHLTFIILLSIGFFLRTFKLGDYFGYGHEQDLQAWIIKDILIDHHPRLIGQETSVTGLFIGPLYYYILALFFFIFKLNPLSSYIPITIISISTLVSIYFVANKLYDKKIAFISSLIYALSPSIIFLDRWVVPTQPTLLWTTWFYFVVLSFVRGNLKPLPILLILTGLVWHIHIAFIPLFLLIPFAIKLGNLNIKKKLLKINRKYLVISFVFFILLITPLFIFEIRHGFQQFKGVFGINTFRPGQAYETRVKTDKFNAIIQYANNVIWSPVTGKDSQDSELIFGIPLTFYLFLGIVLFFPKNKKNNGKESTIFLLWIAISIIFQLFSKHIISQYYFNNLIILSIFIFSKSVAFLFKKSAHGKFLLFIMGLFIITSFKTILSRPLPRNEYRDKSNISKYIGEYSKSLDYECIAINFIGDIPTRYGYRFLLFLNGIKQITPGNDVPVFSIVQPESISKNEINYKSGDIGVILPKNTNINKNVCNNPNRQLFPLNGFVN